MAITPAVHEFLRQSNVAYSAFPHPPAFTAAEVAAVTHTPGIRWAKAVACFADGHPILAVVPAHFFVNLTRLAEVADAAIVRLACEDELTGLFPECETGAMPPFGPLYHLRVFRTRRSCWSRSSRSTPERTGMWSACTSTILWTSFSRSWRFGNRSRRTRLGHRFSETAASARAVPGLASFP
jgi:Ala-tRNA(Pro) deacylase